jgi:hypothetical protein
MASAAQMPSLIEQADFDPETTRVLGEAFDSAWETLRVAGGPLVDEYHATSTRVLLAKHMIEMARRGERDLDRLIDGGLGRATGSD